VSNALVIRLSLSTLLSIDRWQLVDELAGDISGRVRCKAVRMSSILGACRPEGAAVGHTRFEAPSDGSERFQRCHENNRDCRWPYPW
jgi:hypothetical protein